MMSFELGKFQTSRPASKKVGGRSISNQRVSVVLEMVFSLQEKGSFSKDDIMSHLGISRSTFFRSLSDVRCYLQEHRPYLEITLDEDKDSYVILDPSKKQ